MARIPDRRESQRRFMQLETTQRRAVIKAVNRGEPVQIRKHAPIAVGVAQRQQRFWRLAWLMGPVVGVAQALIVDPVTAGINAAVATIGLLAVSWWFHSRARRSEAANRAIAEGRKPPAPTARDGAGPAEGAAADSNLGSRLRFWDRRRGVGRATSGEVADTTPATTQDGRHLPRATGRLRPAGDDAGADREGAAPDRSPDGPRDERPTDGAGGKETLPGVRPYQPRGRKRRR